MIIVNHRVNTVKKLIKTPKECGVEIDIRPFGKKLILNHEPFRDGESLEDFLKEYNHSLLILNIKSEGIEQEVINLVKKYKIKNYFFLDVTFPFMIKYINKGFRSFAVRFSEFESVETCINLKGRVEWVFIDNFTGLPINKDIYSILKRDFKICVVSPDLLKRRNEIEKTKEILNTFPVDAVLTDIIGVW